jgi:hypothetical protein
MHKVEKEPAFQPRNIAHPSGVAPPLGLGVCRTTGLLVGEMFVVFRQPSKALMSRLEPTAVLQLTMPQ